LRALTARAPRRVARRPRDGGLGPARRAAPTRTCCPISRRCCHARATWAATTASSGAMQTYRDNIVGAVLRVVPMPDYQLLGWEPKTRRTSGPASTAAKFRSYAESTECDAGRSLDADRPHLAGADRRIRKRRRARAADVAAARRLHVEHAHHDDRGGPAAHAARAAVAQRHPRRHQVRRVRRAGQLLHPEAPPRRPVLGAASYVGSPTCSRTTRSRRSRRGAAGACCTCTTRNARARAAASRSSLPSCASSTCSASTRATSCRRASRSRWSPPSSNPTWTRSPPRNCSATTRARRGRRR
jgi:hypothetical protein